MNNWDHPNTTIQEFDPSDWAKFEKHYDVAGLLLFWVIWQTWKMNFKRGSP